MAGEEVKRDKEIANKTMREAKAILEQFLSRTIVGTSERGSDTIVMRMDAKRVLVRIRRSGYASRYGDEFTVRFKRQGGNNKTEFQRIMEGGMDYLFYGFSENEALTSWAIGDFKIFRAWICNQMAMGWSEFLSAHKQVTRDGTEFLSIKFEEIPGFIVWRSTNENK